MKVGTGELTCGPLPRANFHVYRGNVSPLRDEKPIVGPVSKNNTSMAALATRRPAGDNTITAQWKEYQQSTYCLPMTKNYTDAYKPNSCYGHQTASYIKVAEQQTMQLVPTSINSDKQLVSSNMLQAHPQHQITGNAVSTEQHWNSSQGMQTNTISSS